MTPNGEVKNPIEDQELKVLLTYLKPHLDTLAANIDSRIEKISGLFHSDVTTTMNIYLGTIEEDKEYNAAKIVFTSRTNNRRVDSVIKLLGDSLNAEFHIYHNVDNPNWLYELQQKQLKTKGAGTKSPPTTKEKTGVPLKELRVIPQPQ